METEKKDFPTWFAQNKHLIKEKSIGFWDKLTPEQKNALSTGSQEELRNVQKSEKLKHTQTTTEGKDTPQQTNLRRGKKEYYAKPDEFNNFLLDIMKKYKNITLDKKANMAISQMEGRELFLNDKSKPIYKKSTIKKMLSELNKPSKPKKTKGKS